MPSNIQNIRHLFGGGWATDLGQTADAVASQDGKVIIPFLTEAENIFYELDGGPRKIGGTSLVNTSAVASGGVITGLFDYWRQGTGGTPVRRRILHAGTVCLADTDDGVFTTSLFTGLVSGAVPNYDIHDDILIIANDSASDVPRSWDQTTAQNLAGTPPNFSFSTHHKNRQWAAGVYANPSHLYYSVAFNPEDWASVGSGSIQINPNDGDMITGIASFKGQLVVFKGPNRGSIHIVTGSSPADFAVEPFVSGLGACWQNAIFQFKDDLGFVSQYGTVHSLRATAAFGDYNEASLSRPINTWIKDHLNFSRLRYITAVNDPSNGWVLFTASFDTSTTNNAILMMDYRGWPENPVKWAYWPAIDAGSLALFVDTSSLKRVLIGGNDGFVRRAHVTTNISIDGATAIAAKVTTPFISYGDPMMMKTLYRGSVGITAKGDYDMRFAWTRDDNVQQTKDINQSGVGFDVLGTASSNQFTLGTSTLAGSSFVNKFFEAEEGGEFRSIQYQFTQSGLNEDMEIKNFSVGIKSTGLSMEN